MRHPIRMTLVLWIASCANLFGQDAAPDKLAKLPGGTTEPRGTFQLEAMDLGERFQAEKGYLVVPENRTAESSRNIIVHFYRIKALKPSGRPPVFRLPGGPGGYYDDVAVQRLFEDFKKENNPTRLSLFRNRDLILMNQRGARRPDERYNRVRFMFGGLPVDKPFRPDVVSKSMTKMAKQAVDFWQEKGMDLAGYDIANMVEDINDVREALKYEKICLRGSSFGSQWSFAYMQKYPQHVDRALLSGVEPLDYGYDSHNGIWNVFKRLEMRLEASNQDNKLGLPENISLTDAFKKVVERLKAEPVTVQGKHPDRNFEREVPLGVDDFRRYLRQGIAGPRESAGSLANLPKYIFEVYNEDYSYLAAKTLQQRIGFSGANLQLVLIDNSLGISAARDEALTNEEARQWVGELNDLYKATRGITPTPLIPDSIRTLRTDIPILLVHGDLDLSTPIENAEAAMETLSNAHLIRIKNGTHGAYGRIDDHDPTFVTHVNTFLDADFTDGKTIGDLSLPETMNLPELNFSSMKSKSLFETISGGDRDDD